MKFSRCIVRAALACALVVVRRCPAASPATDTLYPQGSLSPGTVQVSYQSAQSKYVFRHDGTASGGEVVQYEVLVSAADSAIQKGALKIYESTRNILRRRHRDGFQGCVGQRFHGDRERHGFHRRGAPAKRTRDSGPGPDMDALPRLNGG